MRMQKWAKEEERKQYDESLILALVLEETGAGNGIRTRDPRLGKVIFDQSLGPGISANCCF